MAFTPSRKSASQPGGIPSRWALPLGFLVSVLLHLLLLLGVARLPNFRPVPPASQAEPGSIVLLTRVPEKNVVPRPTPQVTASATPITPDVPVATPTPEPSPTVSPQAAPRPLPTVRPTTPPSQEATIEPEPTPRPIATPKPLPRPEPTTEPGPRVNRPAKPLPRGNLQARQQPRLEIPIVPAVPPPVVETLPATPRIADMPDATPSPIPQFPTSDAGRAGGGEVTAIPNTENPRIASKPVSEDGAGAGGGSGATEKGTGDGAGIGLTRGIPFGDLTGLARGGDALGGGGGGRGPGGIGRTAGGGVRFTLARPSARGSGPPVKIVYVVDVSGSMEEAGKIIRVRSALRQALEELRPDDEFNIVFFADTARTFSKTMRPATNANVSAASLAVDIAFPSGATNMSAGLSLAFQQKDATHIFLMSDGEPTEGITNFERMREFVRVQNTSNARIITMAIGQGERFRGIDLLKQLAEDNGGRYEYINLSKTSSLLP